LREGRSIEILTILMPNGVIERGQNLISVSKEAAGIIIRFDLLNSPKTAGKEVKAGGARNAQQTKF